MLNTVKSYIDELPDMPFGEFYQRYIFEVQDQNIVVEVNGVTLTDVLSVDKFIAKLYKELYSWVK